MTSPGGSRPTESDVVVVGGGLGGMAAAARLAKLGHRVTICERSAQLGGAIHTVERDGFTWQAGPTTTTVPAVLRDLFRKTGRPIDKGLGLVPITGPARRHMFPGGLSVDLPAASRADQIDSVDAALGAGKGDEWAKALDGLGPAWDALRTLAWEVPYTASLGRKAPEALRPKPTMRRLARRLTTDPYLQTILEHPVAWSGSDPRRAPGFAGIETHLERAFGVWAVVGGMSKLVDALTGRLDERGVDVRLEAQVDAITIASQGRQESVTGVELSDSVRLDADIVVADIDPRMLYGRLLATSAANSNRRSAARLPTAFPPYVTHLALREPAPELPPETVLHERPVLVVRAGDTVGTAAPGHQLWTVLHRDDLGEDVLRTLARRGFDVRDQVVARVDRRPQDIVGETRTSPWGTTWGGSDPIRRGMATKSDVDGLFCVGASAHPGPGIAAVALGAAAVATLIGRA